MPKGWEWDESLYRGSAPYYTRGRLPYAPRLADMLEDALALDTHGRLLDVGCGPGTLTLLLAHLFEAAVGVDPDPDMIAEAARRAGEAGVGKIAWVRSRAEDLPLSLGTFRVATFGQSFHWMNRPRVAAIVLKMLDPGGALVHISDVKEPQVDSGTAMPYPYPPYDAIHELARRYLGPIRRAGQGELRHGTPGDEADILRRAGFTGQRRLRISAGEVIERSADDVVAWTYSLSGSAPHLFGEQLVNFEADLRRLLHDTSPSGLFSEPLPDTEVFICKAPER